jgi:hypothetical protein
VAEDPEVGEEEYAEVLSRTGEALFWAQRLEFWTKALHAELDLRSLRHKKFDWEKPFEAAKELLLVLKKIQARLPPESRKTFGSAVKELDGRSDAPMSLKSRLGYLVERRNYLAHDFFVDNSERLLTPNGRARMVSVAEEIAGEMAAGSKQVKQNVFELAAARGLSRERMSKIYFAKRARDRDKPGSDA